MVKSAYEAALNQSLNVQHELLWIANLRSTNLRVRGSNPFGRATKFNELGKNPRAARLTLGSPTRRTRCS